MKIERLFKSLAFLVDEYIIEFNDDGEGLVTCHMQELTPTSTFNEPKHVFEINDRTFPSLLDKYFKGDELELLEYIEDNYTTWVNNL